MTISSNPARRHWPALMGIGIALLCGVLFLLSSAANAQTLKVATGSPKGTYSAMFNELAGVCGNELPLVAMPSSGSMENINLLVGNQVNAAFVQSDVLYLRARTEELGNVKTLLALHNEQIHVLALAESKLKEGGVMGVGSKPVVLTDLASLGGRRMGAAGGSLVTAQVVRLQSEIQYQVVMFDTNDQVLKALNEGQIEAGLFVGGQPLPYIAALGPQYKLLPISAPVQERLKGVYRTSRLNYPKMGAAGVTTVATDALFVTREYKTAKMIDSLAKFRACALRQIDELKETTGSHPAWQQVDVNNRGRWAWYELPAAAAGKK